MDETRSRDETPCSVGFIGDLDDPWVAAIADAVAVGRHADRVTCAGPLPDRPFGEAPLPKAVIVHRHRLATADAGRLERWRQAGDGEAPLLILCVGPYLRYEELERCSGLVDQVVSEAVAADVLPGRLARRLDGALPRGPSGDGPACRIEVAGGNGDLARALSEACSRGGYPARVVEEREIGGPSSWDRERRPPDGDRILTIWEVPVLEPGWARHLEWRALRTGPMIALAGFADRAIVTRAREAGAVACLELPCDLDDLLDVVDRIIRGTPTAAWPLPARVEPPHRLPPPRRNPRRQQLLAVRSRWPDGGSSPKIP